MEWAHDFYDKQNLWSGVYQGDVEAGHREKAALIAEFTGTEPKRVLELGAGGGQHAAATADLGHTVIAVELVPRLSEQAGRLAATRERMTVLNGDFYTVALDGQFDVVCYWDGFGIGTDMDQRRLLQRVAGWLRPTGRALIEIYTPWHAAAVAGRGWSVGEAERRYSFDADGCRWLDAWWPQGKPEQTVQQSLRCYSPADLRLLLEGTSLTLGRIKPGGFFDWEQKQWLPVVPLERTMSYVAELCPLSATD